MCYVTVTLMTLIERRRIEFEQAVRVVTRYAPALSSPWAPQRLKRTPSRRNVAVVSHAQYVLTVTAAPASRVKAAVSKAAW